MTLLTVQTKATLQRAIWMQQGKVVEGTVCSGVFKGATIRF